MPTMRAGGTNGSKSKGQISGDTRDEYIVPIAMRESGQGYWVEDDKSGPLCAASGSDSIQRPAVIGVPVETSPTVLASWGHHGYSSPRGDGNDPLVPVEVAAALSTRPYADNEAQESRLVVAQSVTTGTGRRYDPDTETLVPIAFSCKDSGQDAGEVAPTLRAMGHTDSHVNGGGQVAIAYADRTRAAPIVFDLAQITSPHNRSRAEPGAPAGTLAANSDPHVATGYAVRRLTPRECERLQGFPDDWTRWDANGKEIADTHRYRLMGNAVTVNVIEWIAQRLPA
jgi:DNA (cytosine-5)-methyltransferase 1